MTPTCQIPPTSTFLGTGSLTHEAPLTQNQSELDWTQNRPLWHPADLVSSPCPCRTLEPCCWGLELASCGL